MLLVYILSDAHVCTADGMTLTL